MGLMLRSEPVAFWSNRGEVAVVSSAGDEGLILLALQWLFPHSIPCTLFTIAAARRHAVSLH